MRFVLKICRIFVCGALVLTTSCDRQPPSLQTVRVGVLFPITGALSETGILNRDAVILGAEEINANGGIQSLGGARLELVFGDTEGNSIKGVREAERLINEEGVCAIIGVYQSSVATAVTEVTERLGAPIILNSGIADIITERGFQYTFRLISKAEFYGRDQIRFLLDLERLAGYPIQRVALLHENTAFGTSAALAQKQAIMHTELELVGEESYRIEDATDLSQEVARVLNAKPDAIITTTYIEDSILIARALEKAGANVPVIDTAGGVISTRFVQELGPAAEGFFSVSEYSRFFPAGKELYRTFRQRYGKHLTGDGVLAYQCVYVLKDALERAATLDKNHLREALSKTDLPFGKDMILPSDRLAFDQSGQNKYTTLLVVQIQKGELVPVWPEPFSSARVQWAGLKSAEGDALPNGKTPLER
ncbi:MAG: ABC transporter substrate-binding protein [Desulfatibacillum sp.]|nr:ABC transporter substrate-binding protein [Desulfatibacillum sp.]